MTVILLRHGESSSNVRHTLAGRSPGVELTEHGREQAEGIVQRLAAVPIDAIVLSPLLRCEQTVAPLAAKTGLVPIADDGLVEVDYGEWTGRKLSELIDEPLWPVIQRHASGAVFPAGEGLADVQYRAVAAVRRHERRLVAELGREVLWVACTHGDVIKAILADAFGIHLDGFQRLIVETASISVIHYGSTGPAIRRVNDTGGDLSTLYPAARTGGPQSVPGGELGETVKSG